MSVLATALISYHKTSCLSRTFFENFSCCLSDNRRYLTTDRSKSQELFKTFFNFFCGQRRKRDLNPRAAINDLLPFQGSPFNHLGTSPNALLILYANAVLMSPSPGHLHKKTQRVGFEPTAPCGVTGFQDQLLKPLGHLCIFLPFSTARYILLYFNPNVNNFFYFFTLFLHSSILPRFVVQLYT